jgi:malate dehydrogenase (oxaloacetate-decarboxylating)(NADP+)
MNRKTKGDKTESHPDKAAAVKPGKTGTDLLHDPALNKGTAFTYEERARLGLLGLLPPTVSTLEAQAARIMENVRRQSNDLSRYIEMLSLLDRNETLFYRVVVDNIEELLPIIYTPVVGTACQMYGHIFRRSRGLFVSIKEKGRVREVLKNWPRRDVRVIVVTDGERILGLGDLGANGMGIPVGKLSLYTACAGVPPEQTLPVTLDVGTNNEMLRGEPLYLGLREPRVTGKAYDELVDEFIEAVQEVFPGALIQFEDFANHNAFRLLEKYAEKVSCFNDDIQGTAAVTLAGLYSACRMLGGKKLAEQKLLFHGAGEAAIGIGNLVVSAMEAEGLSKKEAMSRCWFMDSKGLVVQDRKDLQEHKKPYAHKYESIRDLEKAVEALKPTALIGVSGQPGEFTKSTIEAMSRLNERPIVFALSNPTANSECTAEEAYKWSGGKAVFASGSPFPTVKLGGRTFVPGQANNAYIFPGVGLAVTACRIRKVTHDMFLASAKALASRAGDADFALGRLFPPLTSIREASVRIAVEVAEAAYAKKLADQPRPKDLEAFLRDSQHQPVYRTYA